MELDLRRWDPTTNSALWLTFDAASLDRREAGKAQLRAELGLTRRPERALDRHDRTP